MLLRLTSITDFLGTAISLWLGIYLLAHGFTSRVTQRAVVILLSLSLSLFLSYTNLYLPLPNIGGWWAALYTIALIAWYDLTYQLIPLPMQRKTVWVAWSVYLLGLLKIVLLIVFRDSFPTGTDSTVWIVAGRATPLSIGDSAFLMFTAAGIVYNFRTSARLGIGPHSRSTWLATILGAGVVGYGIIALFAPIPIPRIGQDVLVVATFLTLGYAISIHQTFVEQRTTLRDLPTSGLSILGLAGVYVLFGDFYGMSTAGITGIAWLAILTHSLYHVVQVFLDDRVRQGETEMRQRFRQWAREMSDPGKFERRLQDGLDSLCQTLGAARGLIAMREADQFVIRASREAMLPGEVLDSVDVTADDLTPPRTPSLSQMAWLAPVFTSGEQTAVIALGPRRNGGQYSGGDLDLLAESAERVGVLLAVYSQQHQSQEKLQRLAAEIEGREDDLKNAAEELVVALQNPPDRALVRDVEAGLRNLSDFTALGQSPLVTKLGLMRPTHIESGKAVRASLIQAIETLRPARPRPGGVLPREWHPYAVLHDAYIEDVPNREIMARLYVSEGTFNRLRRKALLAVTRALLELNSGPTEDQLL